jgi:hypothetical protein
MNKQEFADAVVTGVLPDVETLASLQMAVWSGDSLMMKFAMPEDENQHDDFIKEISDRFKELHTEGKAGDFTLTFQRVQRAGNDYLLLFKVTPK